MNEPPFESAATLPPEAAPSAVEEPWVGRVLDGRYRLLRKLGEGGMGAVFLAEHVALRKEVALKVIHATFDGHAEIAARFAREAMVSARIEHPHVVSALDYGFPASGGAYLVMQLARGESLRKRLERERVFPWALACEIVAQMADAVAAAHGAGIVHRDLKPENVVVEPGESAALHVKVLDFGIAHLRADATGGPSSPAANQLTRVGTVMGTPGYMSPEQAVGQPIDERTDIYALGVILWELLAGSRPFEGQSLTEIVTKQFAEEPPALPEGVQLIPPELRSYLARMLASRSADRPQSAAEVREWLRSVKKPHLRGRIEHTPLSRLRARLIAVPAGHKALLAVALLAALALTLSFSGGDGESDTSGARKPAVAAAEAEDPSSPGASSRRSKGSLRARTRRAFNSLFH